MNTHSHPRWLGRPGNFTNTGQLVSSTWRTSAAALRSLMACATGARRQARDENTPAKVPAENDAPSSSSWVMRRWQGRPTTNLATNSRAKNLELNRPLAIALGGGGAVTIPGVGAQRQQRR